MIELMLKSGLIIAMTHLAYVSLYKRSTFFTLNRFILIGSMILALILPFISIPEVNKISGSVLLPVVNSSAETISHSVAPLNLIKSALAIVFYAGIAVSLSLFLIRLFRLMSFLNKISFKSEKGLFIGRFIGEMSSFSFFNYICINDKEWDRRSEIIEHEKYHISMFHSIDNLFFELIKCIQWFNPSIYTLHKEIRNLHEFEVDELMIKEESADEYANHLSGGLIAQKEFQLTNPYKSNSNLLKRIKMIYKNPTSRSFKLFYSALIPAIFIAFAVISCNNEENLEQDISPSEQVSESMPIDTEVISGEDVKKLEKQAEYPGGMEAMYTFLGENIIYPEEAKEDGLSGKVFVRFVVASNGKITNVEVMKGIHPLLDQTAIDVIKKMPDWTPGELNGRKVAVEFMLPISFQLK